eukprot:6340596-Pyramimonas_sp.AAC.1
MTCAARRSCGCQRRAAPKMGWLRDHSADTGGVMSGSLAARKASYLAVLFVCAVAIECLAVSADSGSAREPPTPKGHVGR